jgi:hypothetical protein
MELYHHSPIRLYFFVLKETQGQIHISPLLQNEALAVGSGEKHEIFLLPTV